MTLYDIGDTVMIRHNGASRTGIIKEWITMRVKGRCVPVATVALSLVDLGGKVHTVEAKVPYADLGKA